MWVKRIVNSFLGKMNVGEIGIIVICVLAMIALIYNGYRIATDTDTYEDEFLTALYILIVLSMVVTIFSPLIF